MRSEMGFREGDASMLARRLEVFAMALFVVYAVRILAAAVPPRPLESLWQLSLSSALLDAAALPLVALGLLHLAAYLDPANTALGQRRDALARWAILAVLGFLLLLPLQALAAWNSVAAAQAQVSQERKTAASNIALIRQAIHAATSLDDLQARLQSLQTPNLIIRFKKLDFPLAETKRQLLLRLSEGEEQLKMRINPPPPEAIEDVATNAVRVMATSLIYALAFAIAAQRRGQEVPLLVEVMTVSSLKWQNGGTRPRSASSDEEDFFDQLAPPDDDPPPSP